MASMEYSNAVHPSLDKVRRPLFMAEDSGIESEFEMAADESFSSGSMLKHQRENENETLSGRKRRMAATGVTNDVHGPVDSGVDQRNECVQVSKRPRTTGSEYEMHLRQVQLGLRSDSSLGINTRGSYGKEMAQSSMLKHLQDNWQRTRTCLQDLEIFRIQTGMNVTECLLPASANLTDISSLTSNLQNVLADLKNSSDNSW